MQDEDGIIVMDSDGMKLLNVDNVWDGEVECDVVE